jgi:hypothetical protein
MTTAKPAAAKQVRRSVTLPRDIAKPVEAISKQRRLSDNRVLVELIEQGIQARKEKRRPFSSWRNVFVRPAIPKRWSGWVTS